MIDSNGEPWFPAKDVCDMYGIKNSRSSVEAVCDPDEVRNVAKSNVHSMDVSFPNRGMTCVNESGAYALIFSSRKDDARAFRKWVTGTVLPAIRKDGGYIKGEEKVVTGEMSEDETGSEVWVRWVVVKLLKVNDFEIGSTIEAAALLLLYREE